MINQRDIVLIYFPFSNGQRSKLRPVLVISNDTYHKEFQDFIGIAITSNLNTRFHTIKISNNNMETGSLKQESLVNRFAIRNYTTIDIIKTFYIISMRKNLI
jgi:mRNA interferase MazF